MSLAREKSSWSWASGFHSYQTPAVTTICWAENTNLFHTPSHRGTHWQTEEAEQDLGKSPETLSAKTSACKDLICNRNESLPSPGGPPSYLDEMCVFSVGVSSCSNLEVSEAHSWPGVICSTALATARSSDQMLCPAWHSRAIERGYKIACLCPVRWWRRRGEQGGKRSWIWVVDVCWKGTVFCLPVLSAPWLLCVWLCYVWAVIAFGSW